MHECYRKRLAGEEGTKLKFYKLDNGTRRKMELMYHLFSVRLFYFLMPFEAEFFFISYFLATGF
jgi:hypothetical protein